MKSTTLRSAIAVSIAVILLACNKEGRPGDVIPQPGSQLTIRLNNYVAATAIDSALLLFPSGSGEDTLHFKPEAGRLSLSLSSLPSGSKEYRIVLLTNMRLGSAQLLWETNRRLTIPSLTSIEWDAPKNIEDSSWKPRVILNDHTGLIAFSGIRVTDPYFHIHRVGSEWKKLAFSRSYWNTRGGVALVAGREWRGDNLFDQQGNYTNHDFFSFLPQQIGNRSWNHIELIFLFSTWDQSQMRILDYYQDLK